MKGKYHIYVQNSRVRYEFDIRRNITIIRGDSATGKTTLFSMIDVHDRLGSDSGVEVSCAKRCLTINNSNWEYVLDQVHDCIIFIDEETTAIKTTDFAKKIKTTDNYYVIITRENLPNLPYSIDEIYGIHVSGKYMDIRRVYNEFYHIYSFSENKQKPPIETVIAEDSNSGFDFFKAVCRKEICLISASGKSNIKRELEKHAGENTLVIADGAAFGSEMSEVYPLIELHPNTQLYLPESFEWIILSSGLIDGNRISDMLDHPEDFIESKEFFSWEIFFTKTLVQETLGTYLQYTKAKLNPVYLNPKERNALLHAAGHVKDMITC